MENTEKLKNWLGAGSINIFGRPFAGKDTQGERLVNLFGGTLLGGGEILRNSDIPKRLVDDFRQGKLIPSADYVQIVLPYLSKSEFAGKPLVLSSVGRWIGEEKGVLNALEESNHPLKAVIYLELSEDEVRRRWKALLSHDDRGGRHDDTKDVLEKRLQEFREKTLPVLDAYNELGLLIKIDGNQSRDKVAQDIVKELSKRV